MTEKWTPGPWFYRPHKFDDWGYVRAGRDSDGWHPFICQAKDPRVSETEENEARRAGNDPWAANAHLIAAAPDLYRALTGMLRHSCVADAGADMKDPEDHEAERVARAALAKARSEA